MNKQYNEASVQLTSRVQEKSLYALDHSSVIWYYVYGLLMTLL